MLADLCTHRCCSLSPSLFQIPIVVLLITVQKDNGKNLAKDNRETLKLEESITLYFVVVRNIIEDRRKAMYLLCPTGF